MSLRLFPTEQLVFHESFFLSKYLNQLAEYAWHFEKWKLRKQQQFVTLLNTHFNVIQSFFIHLYNKVKTLSTHLFFLWLLRFEESPKIKK